jgi:hypothetical protein
MLWQAAYKMWFFHPSIQLNHQQAKATFSCSFFMDRTRVDLLLAWWLLTTGSVESSILPKTQLVVFGYLPCLSVNYCCKLKADFCYPRVASLWSKTRRGNGKNSGLCLSISVYFHPSSLYLDIWRVHSVLVVSFSKAIWFDGFSLVKGLMKTKVLVIVNK